MWNFKIKAYNKAYNIDKCFNVFNLNLCNMIPSFCISVHHQQLKTNKHKKYHLPHVMWSAWFQMVEEAFATYDWKHSCRVVIKAAGAATS